MPERILVVEDEKTIAELVAEALKRRGYRVELAHDGDSGLLAAETSLPDLVILDVMLPGMDGWEVCRRIRENPSTRNTPVLMLTARREERDLLAGFDVGADDYMKKPFSVNELAARVRSLLRRAKGGAEEGSITSAGPLIVDNDREEAFLDGAPLDLTATEFRILEMLAANVGRVVSRDALLARVWGYAAADTRTVDMHVFRLRRKIEKDPENPRLIHTVRGRGFRLQEEGVADENS
ncbi:MAG TPA: response regulator transcription factor [Synergistales bacterium]|jgi:two-component system phosphate regulon response regulator PhoB/two-component system alkaline phosphatase synthesis response regulator PhoP|nr:response regulator transcription factor [Synergistales bacterium]HRV71859.1 response regulator transcription factor [Thermovirgaceae bacterium]